MLNFITGPSTVSDTLTTEPATSVSDSISLPIVELSTSPSANGVLLDVNFVHCIMSTLFYHTSVVLNLYCKCQCLIVTAAISYCAL